MKNYSRIILIAIFVLMIGAFIYTAQSYAQEGQAIKPYVDAMAQASAGMTPWQLIQAGGIIMVILFILSLITAALIVYDFMVINARKLVPGQFTQGLIQKLKDGDEASVNRMSHTKENIIARIVQSGLDKKKEGATFAREAMENCARTEIATLWQNITYLGDIAAVAPLIGLLGTVIGMIQAFNVIAFQTAVVKPILLAGGVSKAMVTTAGGLIVAIPALIFYSYFRGKVQQIASRVEVYSADLIKFISK